MKVFNSYNLLIYYFHIKPKDTHTIINYMENNIKFLFIAVEEKIDKLKTTITLKRGRYHKNDKKLQNNIEKRKKLKEEICIWKAQIQRYKKEIKEHTYYKEKIQVIFKSKTKKNCNEQIQ